MVMKLSEAPAPQTAPVLSAAGRDHQGTATDLALTAALGDAAHPLGPLDLSDLGLHPDMVPVSTNFSCATCTFSISMCC